MAFLVIIHLFAKPVRCRFMLQESGNGNRVADWSLGKHDCAVHSDCGSYIDQI